MSIFPAHQDSRFSSGEIAEQCRTSLASAPRCLRLSQYLLIARTYSPRINLLAPQQATHPRPSKSDTRYLVAATVLNDLLQTRNDELRRIRSPPADAERIDDGDGAPAPSTARTTSRGDQIRT